MGKSASHKAQDFSQLDARILAQIATHQSRKVMQIMDALLVRRGVIEDRLTQLIKANVIHKRVIGNAGASGWYYAYVLGPDAEPAQQEAAISCAPATKRYPLCHRRDSLVTALFGPA